MAHKRVCLTCKNKGCVNYCRFDKPAPLPPKTELKQISTGAK